ncbi:MAG: DUF4827 domain-containing protein [Bacteroidaceae bacterium]|nr:DUF4827 domain-containing protein [Bacteroidaceae bacterium]
MFVKHKLSTLFLLSVLCAFTSCSNDETYAEQKEREREAVNSFINRNIVILDNEGEVLINVGHINVISEEQFYSQDSTTNVDRNEYVLFGNTGVYMQIVRQGVGEKLKSGQSKQVIARYVEYNIMRDSIQSRNDIFYYHTAPDIIDITNNYGTFTASFNITDGGGAMYRLYNSREVPAGWLVPFSYIRLGRQQTENGQIAKVRLIVPHTQGTSDARNYVYPCFYEILYQEVRQ